MKSLRLSPPLGKIVILGAQLLVLPAASRAANANVNIEPHDFNPANVTINVNDQVIWTWVSDFHSSTSDDGLWDSGVFNTGHVFTNTFPTAGAFSYFCVVHGFTGAVNVQAGSLPPTVAITSPVDGAVFTAPATVPITASAQDSSGAVTNVSFFDGATRLGAATTSPYTINVPLALGSHPLSAVAMDNLGLSATSAVVTVTVNASAAPPSITITNPPNNSTFGNTDTIGLQPAITDTGGTVTNVVYYDGDSLLGNVTTPPFSLLTTLPLGQHNITAEVMDNVGASATSDAITVTVARYLPPITNGNVAILLQPVATNLAAPDYGISPPGDTNRLFVLEQNGLLHVIENGVLLPTPALDLQSRVQPPLLASNPNDERGFLGLAFHPGYNDPASPGYHTLYTYESEPLSGTPTYPAPAGAVNNYRNVLVEWKISSNPDVVDSATRREIVSFGKNAANHNGGTCTFGPDGYLYLALGDGGDANDVGPSHIVPGGNAQNLTTPLGKMLRIDPLNPALTASSSDAVSANGQYRIPSTNPFQAAGQAPEIYAYGLRNPYRFAFDSLTGDLIEGDVGQNNVEEINRIVLGGDYGWPIKEGDFLFNRTNGPAGPAGTIGAPPGDRSPNVPAGLIDPISGPLGTLEYDHNEGIAIIGGFVYRGSAIPQLYGKYIFGDLAIIPAPTRINGRIFYADLQTGQMNAFPLAQFGGSAILPNNLTVHGFAQDAAGELYVLVTNTSANGSGGIVYKLVPVALAFTRNGNQLDISWPVTGGRLQAQTNSLAGGLGNNWTTVAGSTATNHVSVPLPQANASVFYRLAVP